MEPVIDIYGLCTQFGDTVVHRDLDLRVERGDIVSLVGGSGAGNQLDRFGQEARRGEWTARLWNTMW